MLEKMWENGKHSCRQTGGLREGHHGVSDVQTPTEKSVPVRLDTAGSMLGRMEWWMLPQSEEDL